MWVCTNCGKENRDERDNCWHCSTIRDAVLKGGMADPSQTQAFRYLLQDLQSGRGNASARESTIKELSRLGVTNNKQVIDALKLVAVSDEDKHVREAAEETLYSWGYQLSGMERSEIAEPERTKQKVTEHKYGSSATEENSVYCMQCGMKLPQGAKFCRKCGNPIAQNTVSQETEIKPSVRIEPSRPTTRKSLECPQCGRDDKVEKVSVLVDRGTHEIDGESQETAYYVDKKGKTHSEDYYAPYSETHQSSLAARLSSPVKPSIASNSSVSRAIIFWVIAAGLILYGVGASNSPQAGNSNFLGVCISPGILSGIIGIIVYAISNGNYKERLSQLERVELPRWEKARERWNKLYYCSRDDSIFIPSEEAVSSSRMREYIYRS